MFKGIGKQIKGYLLLLTQRQPKKLKTKRRLSKKPPKPRFTLDTQGRDLKAIGGGLAPKVQMGTETPLVRAKKGVFHENCMNCGEPLSGRYCYKCGQKDSDYRRAYWTFLEDLTDNLFTGDAKLWRTLAYLIFFPGAMTRDYVQGKRIRYLPPIRLFLVSIILFFLTINVFDVAVVKFGGSPVTYEERLQTLTARLEEREDKLAKADPEDVFDFEDAEEDVARTREDLERLETWRQEQLARPDQDKVYKTHDGSLIYDYNIEPEMFARVNPEDDVIPPEFMDENFQFDTGDEDIEFLSALAPKVSRGLKNAAEDPIRLNNALNNWVPLIVGVFFIPLTAVFLRFFYWKREHYIFNHMVFSLHFHTYIFFILTFFVLAQVLLGSSVSTWMFTAAVPLYFLVGLKVATGQGWVRTVLKFFLISIFYVVGFSAMLAVIFILAFSET